MKKLLSIILLLSFCLPFTACNKAEVKEISCEDIIKAYESAGYYVVHGAHKDESDNTQLCYIKASLTEDSDSDYIYFASHNQGSIMVFDWNGTFIGYVEIPDISSSSEVEGISVKGDTVYVQILDQTSSYKRINFVTFTLTK